MTATLALFATALALGAMAFFSFVMAPLVFRQLEREQAAAFMRAAFPLYYATMAGTTALAALFAAAGGALEAEIMATVALVFLALRQVLLPALNRHREGRAAGDAAASTAFGRLHGFSILVNFAQLAAVAVVLVRLAP